MTPRVSLVILLCSTSRVNSQKVSNGLGTPKLRLPLQRQGFPSRVPTTAESLPYSPLRDSLQQPFPISRLPPVAAIASRGASVAPNDAAAPKNPVTLFKVDDDRCEQQTIESKWSEFYINFRGWKEGSCSEEGFGKATGSYMKTRLTAPQGWGQIQVLEFQKTESPVGELAAALDANPKAVEAVGEAAALAGSAARVGVTAATAAGEWVGETQERRTVALGGGAALALAFLASQAPPAPKSKPQAKPKISTSSKVSKSTVSKSTVQAPKAAISKSSQVSKSTVQAPIQSPSRSAKAPAKAPPRITTPSRKGFNPDDFNNFRSSSKKQDSPSLSTYTPGKTFGKPVYQAEKPKTDRNTGESTKKTGAEKQMKKVETGGKLAFLKASSALEYPGMQPSETLLSSSAKLLHQSSPDPISVSAGAVIGFIVGSGITFALFRFSRGAVTFDLMAAAL